MMNKIRCYIRDLYQMATIMGIAFATWKLVRHWHAGCAEKTGHDLDATITTTAEKLEKTAIALEEWADSGMGKNLGKDLDEILTDTNKTLDMATGLVRRALRHAK
jgi:hypothetical protein